MTTHTCIDSVRARFFFKFVMTAGVYCPHVLRTLVLRSCAWCYNTRQGYVLANDQATHTLGCCCNNTSWVVLAAGFWLCHDIPCDRCDFFFCSFFFFFIPSSHSQQQLMGFKVFHSKDAPHEARYIDMVLWIAVLVYSTSFRNVLRV